MEIVTVNVSMEVPKETKEVVDALASIYDFVKAKKPLKDIGELFTVLSVAIAGSDKLDDEAKSKHRSGSMGYLSKEMMDRILPVSEKAPGNGLG